MYRLLTSTLSLLTIAAVTHAENWPTWRGPRENGVSNDKSLPVVWSATKNIRWKTALPEAGNSTPIVWGNRIFLTQALDKGKRRAVLCFDRADGKKLWQRELACTTKETTHADNPHCSGSPVTDGQAVYASFASAGIVAYDFDGKLLWHHKLEPLLHIFGNGSSPTLYKDLVIVFHGPGEPTYMIALDKRTGKQVWKQNEHALNHQLFGTWSSPVLARFGQRDELLMCLPGEKIGGDGWVKSYDPATGKELWRCVGLGASLYASATVSPATDAIVAASGFYGPVMAIRPGGNGDVTKSHRIWHEAGKNPQRIGTPVVADGYLYLAEAAGFAECRDARTGKRLWKERLDGKLWGSMLLAAGRLYVSNLEGQTYVLAAGPKFQRLATNDIGEPTYAALAASDGEIFLRTWKHLYCIKGNDQR